jgi:peptidoglycan/xylan/chitin deacetylase (PgdA/CDA1 family)
LNPRTKNLVERAIVGSGLAAVSRRFRKNDVLILGYHNVVPAGAQRAGDASLHLPVARFVEQLDLLAVTHEVVTLESVLSDPGRPSGRPRVVVTFDDAYLGALTIAIPELVRRGMPATVFVAPALLGGYTWWDQVAEPRLASVPFAERETALNQLAGAGEAILASHRFPHRSAPNPLLRIGTEAELRTAAELPGITIGSHTWSHRNMAACDEPSLDEELGRPMAWLRDRFQSFIPVVSYPYGLFSTATLRVASDVGYRAGLRIDGGWLRGRERNEVFALPRYNVPTGLSREGFAIRLAGVLDRS